MPTRPYVEGLTFKRYSERRVTCATHARTAAASWKSSSTSRCTCIASAITSTAPGAWPNTTAHSAAAAIPLSTASARATTLTSGSCRPPCRGGFPTFTHCFPLGGGTILHFTGPPVPITARVHSTPQQGGCDSTPLSLLAQEDP
eukprot:1082151-Prorocentrum_minimum.AAC.2